MDFKKFRNLKCICKKFVNFELVGDVECDWGNHTVIQCPQCQELFSIDNSCPAFNNILELEHNNFELFSYNEKFDYTSNSHPN